MNETAIRKGTIMKTLTLALLGLVCLLALPNVAHARYRDGMNLYQYVQSAPTGGTDPMGLWTKRSSPNPNRQVYESDKDWFALDTIEALASRVDLSSDVAEVNRWLKGGQLTFDDGSKATPGALAAGDLKKKLCVKQQVSVPNVWIAANLMHGGDIVDVGGAVGRFFGTDLFTTSKHKVKVDTFNDLDNAVTQYSGDIWGIVIFGHGNASGYVGNKDGTDWGYQDKIINGLKAQGFRIAQAYPMQCYSAAPNGTDSNNAPINWQKAWESVALRVHGYEGMNVLGIDTKK